MRRKVGVTLGVAEAVRLRLIVANPVRDVRKPKPERKDTAVTLNISAHVAPGAQARAAARLDGILRPGEVKKLG
jgi:hypothetical protein